MLSFAVPGTVIGVGYILAFNVPPIEITGTSVILVVCFIFRNMPTGIRAGIAAMSQLDPSLDEASLTLGARSFTTLRRVLLPLLRPAIIAALVFSFVRAMTAISAVIFLVSADYDMATSYILGRVEFGDYGLAIAYSSVLILVMLGAIALIQLAVGKRELGRRDSEPLAILIEMGNTETAVEFRNVTKAYGEVRAVRNLSFSIERGKLVTLLGPSGCGKTTTLRLIAGLEMVTEGNIFIGGKEVTRLSASDRDVSMVFQSYALFPHMTVMQNVSYGLTMSRLTKAQVSEKALVLCQLIILGYSEVNFVRASSMVNCHLTPRWFWFVAIAQASISSRRSSMSSVRRPLRHCRVMQLNSFSAMFNQLPCLGV